MTKKVLFFLPILLMACMVSFAQVHIDLDVIIGNRAPTPNEAQLMHAEEAKHPNITTAMHDIEKSMQRLHDAPDDFGGRKAQAEADLKQAYISLRKALYFRLFKDR